MKQIKILLEATDELYINMMVERLKDMQMELQQLQTNIKKIEVLISEK